LASARTDEIVAPPRIRLAVFRCSSGAGWLALFCLVWVVGSVALRAGAEEPEGAAAQADVGVRAPGCELASLSSEGRFDAVRSRSFAGRTVLVDFWASWCPTCEHAFPFLNALARDYHARGLEVIAVNLDADPGDALAFLADRPVEFEIAHDPTGRCPRAFGLVGMPTAYLIDADGEVRAVTRGFRTGEAQGLRARIETLLTETAAGRPDPALAHAASSSRP
jgi:cytochrome c biogenesis protein CcmG/thiol:disulfide interchange protein DsbE